MKTTFNSCLALLLFTLFSSSASHADVFFNASGVSAKGVNVDFQAQLSVTGDVLDIFVRNVSTAAILNPDDLLASFYFDIVDNSNNRPNLTNYVAKGDVYLSDKNESDTIQEVQADLAAINPGDGTWQHKTMSPSQTPNLGFGVGTVGNSTLTPNNFNGNIVGAINYSIFTGNITTTNLDNRLLVKDEVHFSFNGMTGFTEDDVVRKVVFGLGTGPDSLLIAVPEPNTISFLLLYGGVGATMIRKRKT